jgi:diguanylate cyclase (GGDEF)-like protein
MITGDTNELIKLSFFVDIGKSIVQAKTIDDTLQEIMRHIGEIFSPLNWSILLINSQTGELTFTVVVGKNADKLRGLKLPPGEGIAGWVAESGQPVIAEDVSMDSRFCSRVDGYTGFTTKSIVGVPLLSNGKVFGVIELINKLNGEPFTPFELKVLTTVADFAAIAIEKAYLMRALKKMASTDGLTGAFNRGSFERQYAREIELCRRYGHSMSLLMLDIDNFKDINDTHGHPAGDAVLKDVVELILGCIRKVDAVFRYGGDEFVVMMPNTDKDQAQEVRKRIQQRIDYQNTLNPKVPYSVSIGLHCLEADKDGEILDLLDKDLYSQKDKKAENNFENIEEHLADMINEERRMLQPKGRGRKS